MFPSNTRFAQVEDSILATVLSLCLTGLSSVVHEHTSIDFASLLNFRFFFFFILFFFRFMFARVGVQETSTKYNHCRPLIRNRFYANFGANP